MVKEVRKCRSFILPTLFSNDRLQHSIRQFTSYIYVTGSSKINHLAAFFKIFCLGKSPLLTDISTSAIGLSIAKL